jgi:TPP-dependent pyruvate/acetoin dehydrogenase alpha subunit
MPEHRRGLEIADGLCLRKQHVRGPDCRVRDPCVGRCRGARDGYGIPGVVVDGNDIFAVYQAANRAVDRARSGAGPSLIECKTYRWRAHTERLGQPDSRDPAEVEMWKGRDPIARLVGQLRDQGDLDDAGLEAIEREVAAELHAAVAFAEASPFPVPEAATDDVFAA